MSKTWSGMIPIWLDAGYKINPSIYAGAFFQYGIGFIKSDAEGCNGGGVSCSGSNMRFGINGHYHLMPASTFDPWVGLGVGYEILSSTASGGGADVTAKAKGFEFVNVQVGGDYKVQPNFGIGPWIGFTMGQYSSISMDPDLMNASGSIKDKAMHQWLMFGVRGVYDIKM